MFRSLLHSALLGLALIGFTAPAVAQGTDTVMRKVKADGVLKVGIAESPPFAIKNPANNTWEGLNVDMANDLAKALGVRLQIVDAAWPTLISGLTANQYDIIMASTFATPERAQQVIFTSTYIVAGELVIVHKDSPFKTHEDLNKPEVTFSVIGGTTNERTVQSRFANAKIRTLVTENQVAPVLEVAAKRADANVGDLNSIRRFVARNPQAPVRILENDRVLSQARRAYAVRPGEYHFLNFLNNWLEGQQLSGRLDELMKKWELL